MRACGRPALPPGSERVSADSPRGYHGHQRSARAERSGRRSRAQWPTGLSWPDCDVAGLHPEGLPRAYRHPFTEAVRRGSEMSRTHKSADLILLYHPGKKSTAAPERPARRDSVPVEQTPTDAEEGVEPSETQLMRPARALALPAVVVRAWLPVRLVGRASADCFAPRRAFPIPSPSTAVALADFRGSFAARLAHSSTSREEFYHIS